MALLIVSMLESFEDRLGKMVVEGGMRVRRSDVL